MEAPTFHRPAEVARLLRCSEWWVKEQARRRRIPYCWIGGGYRFTDQHIAEIAHLFEVRPSDPALTASAHRRPASPPTDQTGPVVQLHARVPRRVRAAAQAAA